MPRALVTGAAGFIGSHLCESLLERGFSVVGMDNLLTGDMTNIEHLFGRDFVFVKHNVSDYIHVSGPLHCIFHFASPASPIDYLKLPIQTLKVGSLGTLNSLGLAKAKGARFLLASTSEVYGDPLIHPQREDYWGNVNPVGPRGVYDEAKRFAEAMTMAYHRTHGVATRIVRIFNSILADETILLFNSDTAHLMRIEDYARKLDGCSLILPRRVQVPSFDPGTGRVSLREATALIKHVPEREDAFLIRTRYGREIRVTGDHSVFRRGAGNGPEAVPVRALRVGEHIAIAARMPVVERDVACVDVIDHYVQRAASIADLWRVGVVGEVLRPIIEQNQGRIQELLLESGRFAGSRSKRNSVGCTYRRYRKAGSLPLFVFDELRKRTPLQLSEAAGLRLYTAGGARTIPCRIPLSDEFLWFLGLFLAEGTLVWRPKDGTYRLLLCSHQAALNEASRILRQLGSVVGAVAASVQRAPAIYVDSKALCEVVGQRLGLGGLSAEKRMPAWVFQLPLRRLKHFLEGYRVGDGTHSGKKLGHELTFETVSKGLAEDLTYALLRFGIVASLGRYETGIPRRPGKRYAFYRLTVPELSSFDILTWDAGVSQTLNAVRFGDLVWARIRSIESVPTTEYVYDFCVPGSENFVAGTGIFAHNTYGPRMRIEDGRAIPAFLSQALRNDDVTVFGDGSQTRSLCYIDDLVDGILRLAFSEVVDPVNIGNPDEMTIRQLAERIIALTGSQSRIVERSLPVDDPKVRQPDITRARTLLGWEPKLALDQGLSRTLAYFRKKLAV